MEKSEIAGWVVDIGRASGIHTKTANTAHDAWSRKNTKREKDNEDALKLVKLSAMNQLLLRLSVYTSIPIQRKEINLLKISRREAIKLFTGSIPAYKSYAIKL